MDTKSEWFDLTPDRSLLDFNFDGYKLSLDSLAQYKLDFKTFTIDSCNLSDIKDRVFFYQHQKLFNLSNHLFANEFITHPRNTLHMYFFDKHLKLIKILFNHEFGTRDLITSDLSLDRSLIDFSKRYVSASLRFFNENDAVIDDGYQTLYICSRLLNESMGEAWSIKAKFDLKAHSCENSILKDVCLNENTLNVVLLNVLENDGKHETFVNWLTFENSVFKSVNKLNAYGTVPDYVCFERGNVEKNPLIILGSSLIKPVNKQEPIQSDSQMDVDEKNVEKFIKWNQTGKELNVKVALQQASIDKMDLTKVEIKENSIEIIFKEKTILNANFHSHLNPSESFWQLNSNEGTLELSLAKKNFLSAWTRLFTEDSIESLCVYETNEEIKSELPMDIPSSETSQKVFDLNQQLEECDGIVDDLVINTEKYQQAVEEDFHMIVRYDSKRYTHKSCLSNNKFLFQITLDPHKTPAFCLRHDVDGLVWQPNQIIQETTKFLNHEHTLFAFGYVQASKTNAKYESASPDCSYACICDTNKHVYIYKQNSHRVESVLRNRKSGKVVTHVSKQYLISLESDKEIIGLYCSNEYIMLLFVDHMIFVHVNTN